MCAMALKEALETDSPCAPSSSWDDDSKESRSPVYGFFPACTEWMNYGSYELAKQSAADNYNLVSWPAGRDDQVSTSPGPLATKVNITQQGFNVARWLFWRQRLVELCVFGGQQFAKSTRKCFEVTAGRGLQLESRYQGRRSIWKATCRTIGGIKIYVTASLDLVYVRLGTQCSLAVRQRSLSCPIYKEIAPK